MANQDPQKVFVSFNGRSVTGWGEDGPTIQRPERVQTNWGSKQILGCAPLQDIGYHLGSNWKFKHLLPNSCVIR